MWIPGRLWKLSVNNLTIPGREDQVKVKAKGSASLLDVSGNYMNVSSRGSLMVKEEYGIPH